MDLCGWLWTLVESKASNSGVCGRLWTPVDTAWRSTDQKVGDSSSPGRASEAPATAGALSSEWSLGQVAGRLWEPFSLGPAFAAIGDSETIDMGGHRRTRSPLGSATYAGSVRVLASVAAVNIECLTLRRSETVW